MGMTLAARLAQRRAWESAPAGQGDHLFSGRHHRHWRRVEPGSLRLQVKEIIYPLGATIDIRQVALGDRTMSVLEIWGAEYQENDCLLIKPDDRPLLEAIAARERCIMQVAPASAYCIVTAPHAP